MQQCQYSAPELDELDRTLNTKVTAQIEQFIIADDDGTNLPTQM